jgi:uncharacterized circularly permuted ATP-grasp superfamily protein
MIRFYLGEDPILPNVPTYDCTDDCSAARARHLDELVVKNTNQSGGYGMLMGPVARRSSARASRRPIEANPRDFIAQPIIPLSCHPTIVGDGRAAPHRSAAVRADGRRSRRAACALTRVALQRRFAGRELVAGRRQQRHLDPGRRERRCFRASPNRCIG